ncbi:MAG TPA: DNA methyltransferase, partial [Rubrobacter sp.]|nr:DNA methyltransferase [Rubrobacter sp.]
MEGIALQRKVLGLLDNFRGLDPLRRLFWSELNYDREDAPLSRREGPETVSGVLAEDPVVLATGADGGFEVIHCRLNSERLSLQAERRVMEKLHTEGHDRALFVFSDAGRARWHFVNTRYSTDEGRRRLYRRITVGPEEEHRTASERMAMLDLDGLEGASALGIQTRHDDAFAVEPVTNEFFREYARVFARVETLVEGIAGEATERKRLFTQRLFNRLMFIAFIQKKGWLRFDGDANYLPALWRSYRSDEHDENFYRDRMQLLFFSGLNTPNEVDVAGINDGGYTGGVFGDVPYLNGGLFERNEDDNDDAIVVPDAAMETILEDLFGRFNFTVTESTPLDVEVAVDPEMLGRVFEELVTGRHETGSYYTPKPVVSFMCREALKGHLGARLPNDSPDAVRRFVEDHEPAGLRDPEMALKALQDVTVCDPACGSGAYLLGMMHELLDLRASLFAAHSLDPISNFDRKLEIIQKSLYGVDIDSFAANIARLRLWLSLVVEFEGEEGQKPPPLPNLDFKIETGDSLTAPDPSGDYDVDMIRRVDIKEFNGLKTNFLKAHGEEKERLRQEIGGMRRRISDWAHPDGKVPGFDWQVEFAEVFAGDENGAAGGFDVILANPPYVRQELIKDLKPALKSVFPEVYTGTSDLYVFFYARALQL